MNPPVAPPRTMAAIASPRMMLLLLLLCGSHPHTAISSHLTAVRRCARSERTDWSMKTDPEAVRKGRYFSRPLRIRGGAVEEGVKEQALDFAKQEGLIDGEADLEEFKHRIYLPDGRSILGSPLFKAVSDGDGQSVEVLLHAGSDATAREPKFKRTALHLAATFGHLDVAKQLLAWGADANALDQGECSALHRAASNGHLDIGQLLVDQGADVRVQDNYKWTPLHFVAYEGHREFAELLVKQGADVGAQNQDKTTPLHRAAWNGHRDIAELLVARGAPVDALNDEGETPLQLAWEYGHAEVAALLQSAAKQQQH